MAGTGKSKNRIDNLGHNKTLFAKNRRALFNTEDICALCGKPVDFSLKYPDEMSATADHIIPIARGGHPTDRSNLQLAHLGCNKKKGATLQPTNEQIANYYKTKLFQDSENELSVESLPQHYDWSSYKAN